MAEVPKPLELAKRGGCWFASGTVQFHLGAENDFRPAKKAHPAERCRDYEELTSRLRATGIELKEDSGIPGVRPLPCSRSLQKSSGTNRWLNFDDWATYAWDSRHLFLFR